MAALVDASAVTNRLDFTLDAAESAAVESAIEDLSNDARYYGDPNWEPATVPDIVKTTIAKAAGRWARNMNGYLTSRAGDETVSWADAETAAGSPEFTNREIKLLKAVGTGRKSAGAFGTISVVARAPRRDADTYIRLAGDNKPMPFVDPSGW